MGTYQVLARTWRPQNFDELVGQRHIAQTLTNAIQSGRLAHAYLFAGLRGTGKTTVARILAKCLNCESGPTPTPCDACDPCREIAESRAIDVFEIDAASRTKVDQTRELLEMVTYAPVRDRHKILIIDEAHMLSKPSFNALLKTLEEPPKGVIFVLATTELQKILPTILSRCQVHEFRRVTTRDVADHLAKICKSEKIRISASALDRIARAGEGSVRDSLSVLERVRAFCGQEVQDEEVLRILGAVNANVLAETLRALAARDAGGMLRVLDTLVDQGHDLLHFWNELIAALRDLLFMEAVNDRDDLLARPPEEAVILKEAAGDLSREDLTRAFQIVADLEPSLKNSSQPRFMFEATLVRLAGLGSVRPIEELLRSLDSAGVERAAGPPAQKKTLVERATPRPPAARPVAPSPAAAASTSVPPSTAQGTTGSGSARPATAPADAPAVRRPPATPVPETTRLAPPLAGGPRLRSGLQAQLKSARPMLAAIFEQARSVDLRGSELRVRFREEDGSVAQPLLRDDGLALLKKLGSGLVGRDVTVSVAIGEDAPPPPAGSAPPPVAAAAPGPSKRVTKAGLIERAKQDPGVKKLLREFGAQVVEIRPLAAPAIDTETLEVEP